MTTYSYFVYGLGINANQPVAGLPIHPLAGPPDVNLEIQGPGNWQFGPIPSDLLLDGVKRQGEQWHSLKVWRDDSLLYVRYQLTGEEVDFAISLAGNHVQVRWSQNFPEDDVPAFFLGPVIGCLLRLRRVLALHAGVVAVDDKAVAFIGAKGAGKSTLISEFARQGYPILSDDVAPLFSHNSQFWVHQGYPRLRLWPATLQWLRVFHSDLPRVESIFEKRYFELSTGLADGPWRFADEPLPLSAIYLLDDYQVEADVSFKSIPGSNRLHLLLQNCYADYILDQQERREQFETLAKLSIHTPLYSVHRPQNLDSVGDTCAAIRQNVRNLR